MAHPIRNVSGTDLIVPGLGRLVIAGQIVDVPDADADAYLCQTGTWQSARPAPDDNPPSDPPTDPSEED